MAGDSPHKELTRPEHQDILSTLTPRAWASFSRADVRSWFYRALTKTQMREVMNEVFNADGAGKPKVAGQLLLERARVTSGSIGGDHRHNIRDAVKGPDSAPLGLATPVRDSAGDREDRGML